MTSQTVPYSLALVILGAALLSFIPGIIRLQILGSQAITALLGKVENHFRKNSSSPHVGGTFILLFLITGLFVPVSLLVNVAGTYHPILGLSFEIFLVFFTLSCPPTRRAFIGLFKALLQEEGEKDACQKTFFIGGDRVISGYFTPLLFAIIGGAPMAMVAEIVRCAYLKFSIQGDPFGKPAADFYRILNYIPAMGALIFIGFSSYLFGKNGWHAIKKGLKEGRRTEQLGHYIQGAINSAFQNQESFPAQKWVSKGSSLLFVSAFFWLIVLATLRIWIMPL